MKARSKAIHFQNDPFFLQFISFTSKNLRFFCVMAKKKMTFFPLQAPQHILKRKSVCIMMHDFRQMLILKVCERQKKVSFFIQISLNGVKIVLFSVFYLGSDDPILYLTIRRKKYCFIYKQAVRVRA